MGGLKAQTMLGLGPTVTWRKGEKMSYGYEISLKYYFQKRRPEKVIYYFEPLDGTRDRLLADSVFAKQLGRFIDLKIAESTKRQ